MKKAGWILFVVFLLYMLPISAYGKELPKKEMEKEIREELKEEIIKRAGYDEEEEPREWEIIGAGSEKDRNPGYFISAYHTVEADEYHKMYYGRHINYIGDVWASKNGVYTKICENVQLDERVKGGIELIEMEGRSFVLVRVRYKQKKVAWYWPDEVFLYSFEGNKPVCYLDEMLDGNFDKKTKIFTAYFTMPLGTFEYRGLNVSGPYRNAAYFFKCENGVFQEIAGEPCTKAEVLKKAPEMIEEWEQHALVDLYSDNTELFFYKIPGVGYYANAISYFEEGDPIGQEIGESVYFSHTIWTDKEVLARYAGTLSINTGGPFGYRYQSWINRAVEEKEIGKKLMRERLGCDISKLISYEEKNIRAGIVQEGDTLWELARKYYGEGSKWKQLYERNRKTIGSNPAFIKPGIILEIKERSTRENEK